MGVVTATVFDFSQEFPPMKQFTPSNMLPDFKSVVGVLRYTLEVEGKGKPWVTTEKAVREVGKEVLAKYFHDNVYHKSLNTICKMIRKVYDTYTEGKHRQAQGRLNSDGYKQFEELYRKKHKLFDVYPEQSERILKCQEEWGGLRMTERDMAYYQDQKGNRLMVCENKCDPIFYLTWLKEQRRQEARERWQEEKSNLFKFRTLDDIKELMIAREERASDIEDEDPDLSADLVSDDVVTRLTLQEEEATEKGV